MKVARIGGRWRGFRDEDAPEVAAAEESHEVGAYGGEDEIHIVVSDIGVAPFSMTKDEADQFRLNMIREGYDAEVHLVEVS